LLVLLYRHGQLEARDAPPAFRDGVEYLEERHRSVLMLLGSEGLSNRQIGDRLNLAENTVRNYVTDILQLVCAHSRAQLVTVFHQILQVEPGFFVQASTDPTAASARGADGVGHDDGLEPVEGSGDGLLPGSADDISYYPGSAGEVVEDSHEHLGLIGLEREVMSLVAQGHNSLQIGNQLHVAPGDVDFYLQRLGHTWGATSLVRLLVMLFERGLLDPGEAPPALQKRMARLTDQQRRVLELLGIEGLSNAQIAGRVNLTERSVKAYVDSIRELLDARTREHLVTRAQQIQRVAQGYGPRPPPDLPPGLDLSDREREVMSLVGQGRRDAEIAEQLHVARVTVRGHIFDLVHKVGATNRGQLLVMLYRGGLLDASGAGAVGHRGAHH
jgi:DNA-binding NarL/FixJ family response regulator